MDYSVIENGKLEINKKSGSINNIIQERVRINKIIANRNSISIESELQNIKEFSFDSDRIVQVLDNLIGNAIKFSHKNSNIVVTSKIVDGKCFVSIKDERPGTSDEDKKFMFKEFQKLTARPTGGENSTGWRLAIIMRMIKSNGETLQVNSTLDQGSDYYFTLPTNN